MAAHDRPVYSLDGQIFRAVDDATERLTRNVLGIWEWVRFTGACAGAVRVDLADEGFISLYNPGREQYMMKADYDQMRAVDETLGGAGACGGAFTRATTEWAAATHRAVADWDCPLTEDELTPGNVRWRGTVDRIAARAQRDNDALLDEERFLQA